MDSHTCIICLGSNTYSQAKIEQAKSILKYIFPDIHFGKEMLTEALFFIHNHTKFRNQLGIFHTNLTINELKIIFKQLENKAGRTNMDKEKEIVNLDIDLLIYDEKVLKPKDMSRKYIIEGLKDLLSK